MAERWNPLRRFLYFACGALLGGLVGVILFGRAVGSWQWPMYLAIAALAGTALLVGTLSACIGDRFWDRTSSVLRWWWPF